MKEINTLKAYLIESKVFYPVQNRYNSKHRHTIKRYNDTTRDTPSFPIHELATLMFQWFQMFCQYLIQMLHRAIDLMHPIIFFENKKRKINNCGNLDLFIFLWICSTNYNMAFDFIIENQPIFFLNTLFQTHSIVYTSIYWLLVKIIFLI